MKFGFNASVLVASVFAESIAAVCAFILKTQDSRSVIISPVLHISYISYAEHVSFCFHALTVYLIFVVDEFTEEIVTQTLV